MKKTLFSLTALAAAFSVNAQVITDTVSLGNGYPNEKWYSLENDETATSTRSSWDLAFPTDMFQAGARVNTAAGAMVWKYPNADTSAWNTLDTTGLSTWTALYDADSVWAKDALTSVSNPDNQFDYGWGVYDLSTHIVTGDSLFVIKTVSGTYKKLWIKDLTNNVYNFTYANLDGTDEVTTSISKSDYANKNYGYYSFTNNATADLEPVNTNWDLLFTKYTGFVAYGNTIMPYGVTGVLTNSKDSVAKVHPIADTTTNYQDQTFSGNANVIGYNWKSFNGSAYTVTDSLVHFVKTASNDVWRVVFTGFDNTNGDFIFKKEKLTTSGGTSVGNVNADVNSIVLYPNPVNNGQSITLVYDLKNTIKTGIVSIFDITGKKVKQLNLNSKSGFNNQAIDISSLASGSYILSVNTDKGVNTQKFIIK